MTLRNDDIGTLREKSRDWLHIGTFEYRLLPHYLDAFGPRITFLIKGSPVFCLDARSSHILTPEQARLMANCLKIAADEAEARARRAQRQHSQHRAAGEIPITTMELQNEHQTKK